MIHFRTSIGVALAISGLAGAAAAADLPSRLPPPAPLPPPLAFTWTGAYFGINGGASLGHDTTLTFLSGVTSIDDGIGNVRPARIAQQDGGFTAGGQVGYNFQVDPVGLKTLMGSVGLVVGMEADAAYLDGGRTSTYTGVNELGVSARSTSTSSLDVLGTVRGRLGVAFDRFLAYGTGGFAYGNPSQRTSLYTTGDSTELRYQGNIQGLKGGYAYGGGIEYALPSDLLLTLGRLFGSAWPGTASIKAEYIRYDLGSTSYQARNQLADAAAAFPGSAYNLRTRVDGNLIRFGLNYRF